MHLQLICAAIFQAGLKAGALRAVSKGAPSVHCLGSHMLSTTASAQTINEMDNYIFIQVNPRVQGFLNNKAFHT